MSKFISSSSFVVLCVFVSASCAQNRASDLPTDKLLSQPGPTFRMHGNGPIRFIAYGDQRFTDPTNVTATNPVIRRWLVNQIASEHPLAVFLNGDVPLAGDNADDYAVRTKPPAAADATRVRDRAFRQR